MGILLKKNGTPQTFDIPIIKLVPVVSEKIIQFGLKYFK